MISGCNTNPPTTPVVIPTGNAILNLRIDNSTNILPVNKVVVLESFTNTGCYPCPVANRIIKQLTRITYGKSKLVAVKFPVNFPAPNDIFHLAAKEICDCRMDYYNVFYAPTIIIDGLLKPTASDSLSILAAIDERLLVTPRFSIDVSTDLVGDYITDVAIKTIDSSGININDLMINIAITETDIVFEVPPGSNGEKEFYDVIRLMLPTVNGISLGDLLNEGEMSFEFDDVILSNWNPNKLNTIVYIQNRITKEIYQSGSTFK